MVRRRLNISTNHRASRHKTYPTAKRGSFQLVPSEAQQKSLARDYISMQDMIFGDIPDFSEIITALQQLEENINTA